MANKKKRESCRIDGFENAIDKNFRCQICLHALEEPLQCRNEEHYFCSRCIIKALQLDLRCPVCREELTIETLKPAPRIITNVLSQLRYHYEDKCKGCCDGEQSGQRGVLRNHASSCAFSPVVCSNKGCYMIINKRDQELHETLLCGSSARVTCEDCGHGIRQIRKCGCEVKGRLGMLKKELHQVKTNLTIVNTKLNETRIELEAEKTKNYQMLCYKEKIYKELGRARAEMKENQAMRDSVGDVLKYLSLRDNIVIAGGWETSSAEMFDWSRRAWVSLPAMNERRFSASSVLYDDQVVVVGGRNESGYAESIEALDISEETPGIWYALQARLPRQCYGHKCVLRGSDLIVTGGCTANAMEYSDAVCEVKLVPPFSSRQLCSLPQPRCFAGVEAVGESKIVILGGRTGLYDEVLVSSAVSVLAYDIDKDQFQEMAPLPFPVSCMATARLQDEVIVIGGVDTNGKPLDTALMYNIKTGANMMLPRMKHKRAGCSAVATGNVLVVMGGYNEEDSYLNSVECFSFLRETWEDLPAMSEPRYRATAQAAAL